MIDKNAYLKNEVLAGLTSLHDARHRLCVRRVMEVSGLLTRAESFEDLCRGAVLLGRDRLGFDRIGLWFLNEDRSWQVGTFGTDEHGRLRDERLCRLPNDVRTAQWLTALRPGMVKLMNDGPLLNLHGEVIGFGSSVTATIWDGPDAAGYISADNLLHGRLLTREDAELMAVYAHALSHL
jgi:hypothetical protein